MKINCGIAKDLLPLYVDEVCSQESKGAIEEHLSECQDCKNYYEQLKAPTPYYNEENIKKEFEQKQISSLKSAKKKWKKSKRIFCIAGIIVGIIAVYAARKILLLAGVMGALVVSSMATKPEVHVDPAEYRTLIGEESDDLYFFEGDRSYIFPEELSADMEIVDFKFVYYNPWDAQYVTYLTVKYDDADYDKEMQRLTSYGVREYRDIYSVTDEPVGYDIVAMRPDRYEGFVYAMIPENKAEENTITYVGIIFCNYFLDLDIHEYLPDEYLLQGFDATMDNPYEKKMMNK